ncbi:MAG: histidine phosphatase family protein [Chloroflexota bacterium]|nr:histidine phosphatase family protein [Chloroflexota bacterium]MDE2896141.1 histidine phosphatase family protein [Chloroflexota bacterium]
MNRIIILRHVESEANRAGVGLGRTDSPPTELGLEQLRLTVNALRDEPITRVLTSPLSRARQLADAIGETHGVEASASDGLIELDVGELEGLEWPIVRRRFAEFLGQWRGDESVTAPMPGGESLMDVLERARPLFDQLVADPSEGTGLIVTHNFVVKMLVVHALQMSPSEWRRIDTGLAGITTFRIADGVPAVVRLNDRHHLNGL